MSAAGRPGEEGGVRRLQDLQAGVVTAVAASVAAVAAAVGAGYARSAARAGREAADSARRTVEVAELSRRAAERARLRQRVERVGEIVDAIYVGSQSQPHAPTVSPWTRGQINLLGQAMIGLTRVLPMSAALRDARSPSELAHGARLALAEIDTVLAGFTRRRPVYRHRRPSPLRHARR